MVSLRNLRHIFFKLTYFCGYHELVAHANLSYQPGLAFTKMSFRVLASTPFAAAFLRYFVAPGWSSMLLLIVVAPTIIIPGILPRMMQKLYQTRYRSTAAVKVRDCLGLIISAMLLFAIILPVGVQDASDKYWGGNRLTAAAAENHSTISNILFLLCGFLGIIWCILTTIGWRPKPAWPAPPQQPDLSPNGHQTPVNYSLLPNGSLSARPNKLPEKLPNMSRTGKSSPH